MTLLLTIPLLIFGYHYLRNGWPFSGLSTTCGRLMWSFCVLLAYLITAGASTDPLILVLLPALSYLSLLVPHGYAMDLGRWPASESKWPSFFMAVSQESWELMSSPERELVDAVQMGFIGLIRGLIVFLPLGILFSLSNSFWCVALITLWHPLAYWLGWRIPYKALNNEKNSAEWGEFLLAISWAVSFNILFGG